MDDYSNDLKDEILDVLASVAGLGKDHRGTLTVVAASVRLRAAFRVEDEDAARSAAAAIAVETPTAAAMTEALALKGLVIQAESAPKTEIARTGGQSEELIFESTETTDSYYIAISIAVPLVIFVLACTLHRRYTKRPSVQKSAM